MMPVAPFKWSELQDDQPIPLLNRRKIEGERILVARVNLGKGCTVAVHHHPNEQIAMMLSGRVVWTLGHPGEQRQVEMCGGEAILLPANYPHGVVALEDCEIIDVLSPPGPMGVDSQSA